MNSIQKLPTSHPIVSVCIPTYNRRELLKRTLDSLYHQTFQDYELIVCDDCSTDGTYKFLSSLKWPRLKVLRNEKNLNLPRTMARLFAEAHGKYIGMQHDHDLYEPEFLEKMVELMERHPTAGLGYCAFHILYEGDRMERNPPIPEYDVFPYSGLLPGKELIRILATQIHTPIPAMGTIFRREIVEQAGGYLPDWYLAADEDMYRRVAAISDIALCRERLFFQHQRPPERHHVLGGWKAAYTLHEFRTDTTKRFLQASSWTKHWNLIRLQLLRDKMIWREAVSLWLHGDSVHLEDALTFQTIPPLPTRRRFLNAGEILALRTWIRFLKATRSLGPWIRSQRAKII